MNKILVVEDEEIIRKQIVLLLERNNYLVTGAATVDEALQHPLDMFDIILADIRLPGAAGTDIMKHSGQVPVVVMTSFASVRSAVESMKMGAVNYISKPFDHDELLLVIARSLHENRLSAQNAAMKKDLERSFPQQELTAESEVMKSTLDQLRSIPEAADFVFLHGERGAGKELCARMIHNCGIRAQGPLVFVDLPSYSASTYEKLMFGAETGSEMFSRQGMLYSANTGTLVIRSIELLPVEIQQQLLEHTTEKSAGGQRSLNVRVIGLSVNSPNELAEQQVLSVEFGTLFESQSYVVAPLRERREDIAPLALHYLDFFVKRYRKRRISFSVQANNALSAYQWPGNVTELKSVVERAVLMVETDEIMPAHLGLGVVDGVVNQVPLEMSLDSYFRYFVLSLQDQLSETELASKLGISRKALWERRQKMNLPRA